MANYVSTDTGDDIQAKLDHVNVNASSQLYKSIFICNDDLSYGSTAPDAGSKGKNLVWYYDIFDDSYISNLIPPDCDVSENIEIYLYWAITETYAANSGEIRWKIDGYLSAVGEDISAGVDSFSLDSGDIDIPASNDLIVKTDLGDIDAGDIDAIRDLLGMKLYRETINDGNDPTADPYVIGLEIRYKSKLAGESI